MHYGDKCVVDGGKVLTSMRSFHYIFHKGYTQEVDVKKDDLDLSNSCLGMGCEICDEYCLTLDNYLGVTDEFGVWEPYLSWNKKP